LISDAPDIAIAVRVADCVPLLMADRTRGVVAAVHAGWRGTVARVAVAAVDALGREFGTRPQDLIAAIGPNIGACCYEVGTELVDAFGYGWDDLQWFTVNAMKSAFIPFDERLALINGVIKPAFARMRQGA